MSCKKCGGHCKRCATCGEMECDHHEFVPVNAPASCICDPMEWADPENIPQVCKQYIGNGTENCHACEHDQECHV